MYNNYRYQNLFYLLDQVIMNQTLVNCFVFCLGRGKTILPWSILKIPDPEISFIEFFNTEIEKRISESLKLASAYAGQNKEALDVVDLNLQMELVIRLFGRYVQYKTTTYSMTGQQGGAHHVMDKPV